MPSPELIIDGYNLIFRLARHTEFRPGRIRRLREDLEAAVARCGRSQDMRPWIVYDGRMLDGSHSGAQESTHLKVSYADPPAEADDLICQLAGQIRAAGGAVEVVTSDGGLAARLRELGAVTLTVEAFQGRLGTVRPAARPQVGDIEAHFLALEAAAGGEEAAGRESGGEQRPAHSAGGGSGGAGEAAADRERRRRRGQRRQKRRLESLRRRPGGSRKRRR
jgi:predicted RNA-binding protein with PIN domain